MNELLIRATPLAFWGVTIHLIVDWMLQWEDMAIRKVNLRLPEGYIHAGLHAFMLLAVFSWQWALLIGVIHLIIDTRIPLDWWRKTYKQTTTGEMAIHVAIWQDQVAHWIVICIAALLVTRGG